MDNLTTPSALGIDDEGNSHVSTLDNKPTSFVLKKEATESNFMKAAAELKLLGSSEPTVFELSTILYVHGVSELTNPCKGISNAPYFERFSVHGRYCRAHQELCQGRE